MPGASAEGNAKSVTRHQPRISLRLRLTLWVVAIFVLIQLTVQGVFWLYQRSSIYRIFDEQLSAEAARIAEKLEPMLPAVAWDDVAGIAGQAPGFPHSGVLVIDAFNESGVSVVGGGRPRLSWGSLGLAGVPPDGDPKIVRAEADPAREARVRGPLRAAAVRATGADGRPYTVVVATSDRQVRIELVFIGQVALVSSVIGTIAATLSGWFIAGIAVAPLARLTGMARELGPESIGRHLSIDDANIEVARLTKELDDARQRIQNGFIAKERFLSNVSHEIRTPISVILMEAQTLNRAECPAAVREFIKSVEEEMLRLGRLVESFLMLTRISDSDGLLRLKHYAANDLVMDSVEHCSLMAEQHGVALVPDLLSDDDTIDTAVAGDPELLRTMMDNLVRNAIRFSPRGGSVRVSLACSGGELTIVVSDEGAGIPASRLATLFDQMAPAPEAGRGHGFGLAIAQGIAELHGGIIAVCNRPAGGCEFSVTLPTAGAARVGATA